MTVEGKFQRLKQNIEEQTNKKIRGEERKDSLEKQQQKTFAEFNETLTEALKRVEAMNEEIDLPEVESHKEINGRVEAIKAFIEDKINRIVDAFMGEGVTLSGRGTKFQQLKALVAEEKDKKIRNEERVVALQNESERLIAEVNELLAEFHYDGEVKKLEDVEKVTVDYENVVDRSLEEMKEIFAEEGVEVD